MILTQMGHRSKSGLHETGQGPSTFFKKEVLRTVLKTVWMKDFIIVFDKNVRKEYFFHLVVLGCRKKV